MISERELGASVEADGETAVVYAGDYLNKLSGERVERECRKRLEAGCKRLIVNFTDTEIINSIGISILLGVIDSASGSGTDVVFAELKPDTIELFELLGLTKHVTIA